MTVGVGGSALVCTRVESQRWGGKQLRCGGGWRRSTEAVGEGAAGHGALEE